MAKDAKVGLLLGLVFIVAIAVVLRGVHRATHKAIDESLIISKDGNSGSEDIVEPTELSSQADNLSRGADDSSNTIPDTLAANQNGTGSNSAVNTLSDGTMGTSIVQGSDLVAHAGTNPNIAQTSNGYAGNSPDNTSNSRYVGANDTSQYNNNGEIRYNQALPGQSNTQNQIRVTPPSGQLERAVNNVRVPLLNGGDSGLASGRFVATGSGARNGGLVSNTDRTNSLRSSYKIYIVRDGDNLSKIALKVYGAVAGKRWVNVKRIYKANGKALKSMDDIYVGQRLRIPALPGSTNKTAAIRSGSEHSVNLGNRLPVDTHRVVSRTATGRVSGVSGKKYRIYVVKEGDTPWGIAQKQLGNGARFTDIGLPQGGHVTKHTTIFPGMRLRIPLR